MFEPSTVVAIALKTSLLVVAVCLIARLMARQSAAWRHLLWTSALALSLLMPVAIVYVPSYVQLSLPWEAAQSWVRDEPIIVAGARQDEAAPESPGLQQDGPSSAPPQTRAAWPTVMVVWLLGVVVVLLHNALAHVGLMRWVRRSRSEISPAWAGTLRRVTGEAGLRRRLRVLESDHVSSPCTWGLMRPVVMLPAAGADWPESQRRFALLHELAHVGRFDYLTTQIANLACAAHWYNPLVWFAAVQARKLQERACDDVVLNDGGMPSDYAQFLMGIAGGSRRLSLALPAAVGMVQRSQLHGRVTAILDAYRARLPLSGLAFLVAVAPLTCLMLFLATVSAIASPLALQPGIPLAASFSAVELRNGGMVNLIHGESQRVTLLSGDPEQVGVTLRDDGRLVIDRCALHCPRGHELEVEVVTPALAEIAVAEGGTIQSRGDFPYQAQIRLAISQGGTIDVRFMTVASVAASVESGGRIFVKPITALSAKVAQGGNITYWGDAVVKTSVRHGGVVVRGAAADADKRLSELGPELLPPIPPTPPVPPIPALKPTRP